jgi:hypothetical protein
MTPVTLAVKRGSIGREMVGKILPESSELTLLLWLFYMPQICDMGAGRLLLPLREEGVLRIYFPP